MGVLTSLLDFGALSDTFSLMTILPTYLPLGSPIIVSLRLSDQPSAEQFMQSFLMTLLQELTLLGPPITQVEKGAYLTNWAPRNPNLRSYNGPHAGQSQADYTRPYHTISQCTRLDLFVKYDMQTQMQPTIRQNPTRVDPTRLNFIMYFSFVNALICMPFYDSLSILALNQKWKVFVDAHRRQIARDEGRLGEQNTGFDGFFETRSLRMLYTIDDVVRINLTAIGMRLWQQFSTSNVGDKVIIIVDGLATTADAIRPMCNVGGSVPSGYFGIEILHTPC